MKNALFGGVNAAVLTPFRADLSPDLALMAAHCRWLLAHGCDNLAVFGTTGEANSLGIDERMDLLQGLVAQGVAPARLLPGLGTTAIPDTVRLLRQAGELGCRAALLLPPFFYKNPSDDGIFAYFSEVIGRSATAMKIYLYHFPALSAVPFGLDLVSRLRRAFPGVIQGIKDSTGDFAQTRAYAENFAAEGFEVYCGDDAALLDLLRVGGAGSISGAANVSCALSAQVHAAWRRDDGEAAAAAQSQLSAVRAAVTRAPLIPALKALLARRSGMAEWAVARPPHSRLSPAAEATLFAAFDACGAVFDVAPPV